MSTLGTATHETQAFLELKDYITQVSEEGRRKSEKKLSKGFKRTKSQILGALSKLNNFFPNLQVQMQSRTILRFSQNFNSENQEPNEACSLNDSRPEVDPYIYLSPQSKISDPHEATYSSK